MRGFRHFSDRSAEAPLQAGGPTSDLWCEDDALSSRAHGVVVSHPLSMQEVLGSIPSVSIMAVEPHEIFKLDK